MPENATMSLADAVQTNNDEYILEMEGIDKSFGGVRALENARLRLRRSSVHALCGENGAGKSTLMKVLTGLYQLEAGKVTFCGKDITGKSLQDIREMGIAMIHQELTYVPEMTVAENMYLGQEPLTKRGLVDYKKLYSSAQQALDEAGIRVRAKDPIRKYSVAQIQSIEILKATNRNAKIVIMDEPTSALTEDEVEKLYENIKRLKAAGVSILYISHRMEEIFNICDEVTVLRDGKWIGTHRVEDVTNNSLIAEMVGRPLESIYPPVTAVPGEVLFEVKNLEREGVFHDISFSVRRGEILGISGLVGAGRTEVARAIVGLDPLDGGTLYLDGKQIHNANVQAALRNKVVMVPEDRKRLGLILCRRIGENASLPHLKALSGKAAIHAREERENIKRYFDVMRVKAPNYNAEANTLSGGNQQKVVLAKWIMGNPKVLILDEPTRGVDVGAKYEIYELINELALNGTAVIMISSELPEVLGMSHRILTMYEGRVTGELSREEATPERVMKLSTKGVTK